jgi:hypothetical protein
MKISKSLFYNKFIFVKYMYIYNKLLWRVKLQKSFIFLKLLPYIYHIYNGSMLSFRIGKVKGFISVFHLFIWEPVKPITKCQLKGVLSAGGSLPIRSREPITITDIAREFISPMYMSNTDCPC